MSSKDPAKKKKKVKTGKKSSEIKEGSTSKRLRGESDDLDDLFALAKAKKQKAKDDVIKEAAKEQEESLKQERKREMMMPPPGLGSNDKDYGRIKSNLQIKVDPKITNPEAPVHRWDKESGLPVYKAAALKAFTEESGGTAECPFDCNCCF